MWLAKVYFRIMYWALDRFEMGIEFLHPLVGIYIHVHGTKQLAQSQLKREKTWILDCRHSHRWAKMEIENIHKTLQIVAQIAKVKGFVHKALTCTPWSVSMEPKLFAQWFYHRRWWKTTSNWWCLGGGGLAPSCTCPTLAAACGPASTKHSCSYGFLGLRWSTRRL